MADTFVVIAEPTRRRILDALRGGPVSVGGLVDGLDLPQPTVSKHLRTLRDAGLVTATVDAQRRVYRLDPAGFRDVDQWLAPYRAMWSRSLDALEASLAPDPEHPEDNHDHPHDPATRRTARPR